MSRDFDLLRSIEKRSKSAPRIPRREIYPESVRPADINGSHPPRSVGSSGSKESDWIKVLAVIRKRWKLAGSFVALVVAAAALIVFLIKPEYQPSGRLEIDPPGGETFTM